MSDCEPLGNPLASFMNGLIHDRMLQHAHHEIIVIADNCASSRIQSYRKEHKTPSVSSIPELSRWDSHPIRAEKHQASINDAPRLTNSGQRKPQCPRRTTSFDSERVEENTSSKRVDLQICPPKPPARRTSLGGGPCVGWFLDTSGEDDSGSCSSSSSLLSNGSPFVEANRSPISSADSSRLSSSTHSRGGELSTKIQSERLNRSCMDLAPSGTWNVRSPLPMMEFDDRATLKHHHRKLRETQLEQCTSDFCYPLTNCMPTGNIYL
jgi:hypothetical protein